MSKNCLDWKSDTSVLEDLDDAASARDYRRLETVLIIEDQKDLSRALALRLDNAGLNVACAFDGIAGLEKIVTLEPDLIILDLHLPRLHGFKLLDELRKQKRFALAPIIIMTGDPGSEIEERASHWGIRRVFRKPIPLRVVVEEVLDALREA